MKPETSLYNLCWKHVKTLDILYKTIATSCGQNHCQRFNASWNQLQREFKMILKRKGHKSQLSLAGWSSVTGKSGYPPWLILLL